MVATTVDTQPAPAPLSPEEIRDGRTMAVMSYVPIFLVGQVFSVVGLVDRRNNFALYHAKQAVTVYLLALALMLAAFPLYFVHIGFAVLRIGFAGVVGLCIVGILNAGAGRCRPLPFTGRLAEKWFARITKKA